MKYTIWRTLKDEGVASTLLDIANDHVKLALEYSNTNTLPCRREAIKAEIQRLRMERDDILERSSQASNKTS